MEHDSHMRPARSLVQHNLSELDYFTIWLANHRSGKISRAAWYTGANMMTCHASPLNGTSLLPTTRYIPSEGALYLSFKCSLAKSVVQLVILMDTWSFGELDRVGSPFLIPVVAAKSFSEEVARCFLVHVALFPFSTDVARLFLNFLRYLNPPWQSDQAVLRPNCERSGGVEGAEARMVSRKADTAGRCHILTFLRFLNNIQIGLQYCFKQKRESRGLQILEPHLSDNDEVLLDPLSSDEAVVLRVVAGCNDAGQSTSSLEIVLLISGPEISALGYGSANIRASLVELAVGCCDHMAPSCIHVGGGGSLRGDGSLHDSLKGDREVTSHISKSAMQNARKGGPRRTDLPCEAGTEFCEGPALPVCSPSRPSLRAPRCCTWLYVNCGCLGSWLVVVIVVT
jgi:hypothetical protein